MKFNAVFIATSALAKSPAKKAFEEIFGDQRQLRARTDGIQQQVMFYLTSNGMDMPMNDMNAEEFQYGCWGQIGHEDIAGHGEPLDEIDMAYRRWHSCKQCAGIDGLGTCQIDGTPYEVGFDPVLNRIDCSPNSTPCAVHLCSCDEQLAFDLVGLWETWNDELKLGNGFDHAANCHPAVKPTGPPTGGNGQGGQCEASGEPVQMCCGEYPNRFPFSDKGGCIACCAAKTYNVFNKSCCDGAVKAFGAC